MNAWIKSPLGRFLKIGFAEGLSYLILIFIAMPLKYMAHMPLPVRIVGMLHGVLFVGFIVLAYMVKEEYKKDFKWMLKAGLASIIPFGTFYMDKEWKKEEAAATSL